MSGLERGQSEDETVIAIDDAVVGVKQCGQPLSDAGRQLPSSAPILVVIQNLRESKGPESMR